MIKRTLNTIMSEDWLKSALVLALLLIGCVGLVYGARMAYKFGMGMSHEHAVTLVLVALLAAMAFPAADLLKKGGWSSAGKLASRAGAICLAVELMTHMGYTFGQRHENVTKAVHQTVSYKEQVAALDEQKRDLTLWEKRLSDLTGQNGWSATVTADGLRAKLPGLDLAISQEAARGGCKAKCLDRTKERDEINSRVAILEERTDLQKKIEATKRVLDKQRDKTAHTDLGNSAVVEQSAAFAKLAHWDLNPDAGAIEWTKYMIGVLIAVVTVIIAPVSFKLAFLIAGMAGIGLALTQGRKEDETPEPAARTPAPKPPEPKANVSRETPGPKPTEPINSTTRPETVPMIVAQRPTRHVIETLTIDDIMRMGKAA